MKINEVIVEGIIGNMAKAVGKGIVKGAADFVAPGAEKRLKAAKYSRQFDKMGAEARKWETDPEVQAAVEELLRKAQANGGSVDFDDIKASATRGSGLSEAEGQFDEKLAWYLVKKLQAAGVTINGLPQEQPEEQPEEKPTASMVGRYGKKPAPTVQPTQPQQYQSPLGITVLRSTDEGHILGYEGKKYWPNNRGDWAINGKDAVTAVASPQLAAEMDKVAGFN